MDQEFLSYCELVPMPITFNVTEADVEVLQETQYPPEVVSCEMTDIPRLKPINESANLGINPILYKFRFSFKGDWSSDFSWDYPDSWKLALHFYKKEMDRIISYIQPHIVDDVWVAGLEYYKKGMEQTTPHFHLHYLSNSKKNTIDTAFKRAMSKYWENEGRKVTGNKIFSNTPSAENNYKLWRYPMKQQQGDTQRRLIWGNGFEKFVKKHFDRTPTQMRDDAYAVWLTACEVSQSKAIKQEEKKELQDRLFVYLDRLDNKDDRSLKIGIQKFYILEEKRPFNKTTALGYFYNYKILSGLMTHEELVDTW